MTYLLNKARQEYYIQFMEENGSDQGKLFKSANRLVGIQVSLAPCFPDHLDNMSLANDVANFFVKKIDNIHSQITLMRINASRFDKIFFTNVTTTFVTFKGTSLECTVVYFLFCI